MTSLSRREPSHAPASLRDWSWRHPEAPFAAVAAAAALLLAWRHITGIEAVAHHGQAAPGWSFDPLHWWLMVVASMVPGLLPMVRRVAFDSLWDRRYLNASLYVAAYVTSWGVVGMLAAGLVHQFQEAPYLSFAPARVLIAGALSSAALWQFAPTRRRALQRMHLMASVAPRGWNASRDIVRAGLLHSRTCMVVSAPAMCLMVLLNDPALMVPVALVTVFERYQAASNRALGATVFATMAAVLLLSR